jgi:hypothetical protein
MAVPTTPLPVCAAGRDGATEAAGATGAGSATGPGGPGAVARVPDGGALRGA